LQRLSSARVTAFLLCRNLSGNSAQAAITGIEQQAPLTESLRSRLDHRKA
jgi:hypothetical protein